MYIESLELKNFRNYEELSIVLGRGRISFMEIMLREDKCARGCLSLRNHKISQGSKDKEMIRFEQDESHIRMMVKKDGVSHKIDMHLKK